MKKQEKLGQNTLHQSNCTNFRDVSEVCHNRWRDRRNVKSRRGSCGRGLLAPGRGQGTPAAEQHKAAEHSEPLGSGAPAPETLHDDVRAVQEHEDSVGCSLIYCFTIVRGKIGLRV